MSIEVPGQTQESPEIVYYPSLIAYARELDKLTTRRRVIRILRHFDKEGLPDDYQALKDAFYNKVKFELHINQVVLDRFLETGTFEGTRFLFESGLGLQDLPVFYGSVRSYQDPKPFRLVLDSYAAAQAGLFFPHFPGVYPDKRDLVTHISTFDGLASLAIAQSLKLIRGERPEMMLLLGELPAPLEELIETVYLPRGPKNDPVAFLLRRRGIRVIRLAPIHETP